MVRNNIIDRLETIRTLENNFSKTSFRWKDFYIDLDRTNHISETNFTGLSNLDLINTFERVIHAYYKQG